MRKRTLLGGSLLLTVGLLIPSPVGSCRAFDRNIHGPSNSKTSEITAAARVDRDYEELLRLDKSVEQEVEALADRADEAKLRGDVLLAPEGDQQLNLRLREVRHAYEGFLQKHPKHADARIAFGNFLFQNGEEEMAVKQWERATRLDPKNPESWNNLAHYYQHRGPVKKAFRNYTKAIKLNPREPVFLRNLAGSVYVFRKDAMEYYGLSEREVFNKAIQLYRQALKLDPKNFQLATELAESFYLIKPLPTVEALQAWNDALEVAENDFQRESVYLHMARVEMKSGMFEDARKHLDAVTNVLHNSIKGPLVRTLDHKLAQSTGTP
jgi:Flp pilus assembly protein TadD